MNEWLVFGMTSARVYQLPDIPFIPYIHMIDMIHPAAGLNVSYATADHIPDWIRDALSDWPLWHTDRKDDYQNPAELFCDGKDIFSHFSFGTLLGTFF